MLPLTLHGHEIETVFDLLGNREDDITYSLGWGLSHSEELVRALLAEVFDEEPGEILAVRLQEVVRGSGRTDIEIETQNLHLIVEAKRAYDLPTRRQLAQYARRLHGAEDQAILVTASWSATYAGEALPLELKGERVVYRDWNRIAGLVEERVGDTRGNEQRLLRELHRYLQGVMTVQDIDSNLVYVVSLNMDRLGKSGISFKDIVVEHDRYFHPMGRSGWPKVPPNYLGFRYDGKLQQVRHVEDHDEVIPEKTGMPGFPELEGNLPWTPGPHMLYQLGPPLMPRDEIRTGQGIFRNARCWVALDLLLTGPTISEARDATKARREAAGAA